MHTPLTLSSPPTQPSSLPKILSISTVEGGGVAPYFKKEEEKEETNEAEKTCTDNGGTWDGSACTYPSTEPTEPTEPTTPEPTEPSTPEQILPQTTQQAMFGLIEEISTIYSIDNNNESAQLSTFFVHKKNRDHFPVSSIVFAI